MSKKYKPKEETGREYVDHAKEFCSRTIFYCMKLPERWKEVLLLPMIQTAEDIELKVVEANKIYINASNMKEEALIQAYQERIRLLHEALREFAQFDVLFERMMSFVNVSLSEKKRLKNILLNIIKEEQEKNPALKNLNIRIIDSLSEMRYVSVSGERAQKLSLSRKNRDVWLKSEQDALDWIKRRLASDKRIMESLQKKQLSIGSGNGSV